MAEEEEETIISKNSALYAYLLESNNETEDENIQSEKDQLLEQLRKEEQEISKSNITSTSESKIGFFEKLLSNIRRLFSFEMVDPNGNGNWISKWIGLSNATDKRGNLIRALLDSRILDDDDETILRAELEMMADRYDRSSLMGTNRWGTLRSAFRYLSLFAPIPYAIFRYYQSYHSIVHVLDAFVLLLAIPSGISIDQRRRAKNESRNLSDMLESSRTLDVALRKALRTIRDYEVLARGYTVITKYTVIANVANETDQESKNVSSPCPQLRQCVFLVAEEMFHHFRDATLEITKRSSSSKENVHGSSFLLAESEELPAMFGDYSKRGDWRISLSVLQNCCYCMTLQRSEFLRLLVSVYGGNVSNFLKKSVDLIHRAEESVRRALIYYTSQREPSESESTTRRQTMDHAEDSPMYDYVHSLGLHLRSALKRSVEFEERLQRPDSSESIEEDSATFESYREELKSTLKKCQTCFDELEACLDSTKAKKDHESGNVLLPPKTADETELAKSCGKIFDGTVPEIEDQVFEASTIERDNGPNSSSIPSDDRRSDSDQRNGQLFISGRRHVLDELKSVLTIRSTLMRERELRALANRRGVTVEDLLAEEAIEKEAERKAREEEERARDGQSDDQTASSIDQAAHYRSIAGDSDGGTLASELSRIMQLKGFDRRKQETVLGDDDTTDDDEDV